MSTLKDLARIMAERNDMQRTESEQFVITMFDVLKEALAEEGQIKIKGLGTFKVQTMKERASVNINTGEKVIIDSHERVTFTPDTSMRDSVNKPFAHFDTVVLNEGVFFDDIDAENDKTSPEPVVQEAEKTFVEKKETTPLPEEPPSAGSRLLCGRLRGKAGFMDCKAEKAVRGRNPVRIPGQAAGSDWNDLVQSGPMDDPV